jgi:hypothetical protein
MRNRPGTQQRDNEGNSSINMQPTWRSAVAADRRGSQRESAPPAASAGGEVRLLITNIRDHPLDSSRDNEAVENKDRSEATEGRNAFSFTPGQRKQRKRLTSEQVPENFCGGATERQPGDTTRDRRRWMSLAEISRGRLAFNGQHGKRVSSRQPVHSYYGRNARHRYIRTIGAGGWRGPVQR